MPPEPLYESRGQHKGRYDSSWLFLRTMCYSLRRALSLDSVDGCTHNPKVGGSNPPPATNLKFLPLNHLKLSAGSLQYHNRLPLRINHVDITGDFLAKTANLPRTLKHGEFLVIAVSFAPKGNDENSGTLRVSSSTGSLPDVYLYGNGLNIPDGLCFASPGAEILVLLVLSLLYWLTIVIVRWHRVARPTRELLRAQMASVQTEMDLLTDRAGPGEIDKLLSKGRLLLDPGSPSAIDRIANFLFWSRGQEITGWGYVHEVQIQMAKYLAPETVFARLGRL